ncbi:MAG: hypothetical protein HYY44_08520 [Deltaproteobacteria bacterium]|nr:hypothetical protein [Deltaproteobacteria bacterium]MBI4373735.1 hypothetical protein [Deltaproteobacteria bacterium]
MGIDLLTRYTVADNYPHKNKLPVGGKSLGVVSSSPISPENLAALDNYLKILPQDLKDLFQQSNESFSIALSTRREIEMIAGQSTFGVYDRVTKLIYLPVEYLSSEIRPQGVDTIRHEIVHATIDSLVPDSLAVKCLFSVSRIFTWTRFAFQDFYQKWHSPDTSSHLAFLSSVFLFLAPSSLGSFFFVRRFIPRQVRLPAALGSLAVGVLAGVLLYYDAKRSYPDGRGIIKDEYERFKKAVQNEKKPLKLTVSLHGTESVAEFSAESMQAYLQKEKEGFSDGTKTREGLSRKHPRLYLAYAAFFDLRSPARFSPKVFDRQDLIDQVLRKHKTGQNSYNLESARNDLFLLLR